MDLDRIKRTFASFEPGSVPFRSVIINPGLDARRQRELAKLRDGQRAGHVAEEASRHPSELILAPHLGRDRSPDWACVDGIRADSLSYLVDRHKLLARPANATRGGSDVGPDTLEADLEACRAAWWDSAVTAAAIQRLLSRIEASPDHLGPDIDNAYRHAVDEHRRVLGTISSGVARLRAENELRDAQQRDLSATAYSPIKDAAERSAAVRQATAELNGLPEARSVVIPAGPSQSPGGPRAAPGSPAAESKPPAEPRRKARPTTPLGPPLELRSLGKRLARRVAALPDPKKYPGGVRIAAGHVLWEQRHGSWIPHTGRDSLDEAGPGPYWLVNTGWQSRLWWWGGSTPDGDGGHLTTKGSAVLVVTKPEWVATALDSGQLASTGQSGAPVLGDDAIAAATAAVRTWLAAQPAGWPGTQPLTPRSPTAITDAVTTVIDAHVSRLGLGVVHVHVRSEHPSPPRRPQPPPENPNGELHEQLRASADRFTRITQLPFPRPGPGTSAVMLRVLGSFAEMAASYAEDLADGRPMGPMATLAQTNFSRLVQDQAFHQAVTTETSTYTHFMSQAQAAINEATARGAAKAIAADAAKTGSALAASDEQPPVSTIADRLRRLKGLADAELITAADYESAKASILSEL